jgi:hypothetical protein
MAKRDFTTTLFHFPPSSQTTRNTPSSSRQTDDGGTFKNVIAVENIDQPWLDNVRHDNGRADITRYTFTNIKEEE